MLAISISVVDISVLSLQHVVLPSSGLKEITSKMKWIFMPKKPQTNWISSFLALDKETQGPLTSFLWSFQPHLIDITDFSHWDREMWLKALEKASKIFFVCQNEYLVFSPQFATSSYYFHVTTTNTNTNNKAFYTCGILINWMLHWSELLINCTINI